MNDSSIGTTRSYSPITSDIIDQGVNIGILVSLF